MPSQKQDLEKQKQELEKQKQELEKQLAATNELVRCSGLRVCGERALNISTTIHRCLTLKSRATLSFIL